MRHWRTTGNSNVAIQTGSTYISHSMTAGITTTPTAYLGVSTRASSQKVRTSNCNIERQTQIAICTKTGNSYNTGTMTNSVEIPTASPGFLTIASPNKVLLSNCDSDRQPEMATWPPKPEILISLELWRIEWQFQRQIWSFRPRPARRNWSRAIATTTDSRKWQYSRFGRQSYNFR